MNYRGLTKEEIQLLQDNRCSADDWSRVKVGEACGDVPEKFFAAEGVRFEGEVNVGCGCTIADSTISDCTIGPRTEIRNVGRLQNYVIGTECHICDCGHIVAKEFAAMGCGVDINVLDETGSRQVPICPELTAQTAYIMAFYHHDMALVNTLADLVRKWREEHSSREGSIGDYVEIRSVATISDVNIGPRSLVCGAVKLENGTLGAESLVRENASASDFIMSDNAVLGEGCIIRRVFLGQASRLDNAFIAQNSLIFANSVLECGEAEALFAGPHTVSHHRSTLLIATATSFFNAGSGTNESNHNYRLGPIHYGIMERGCKTGSNTYIKWPARFGQFSVITGSHFNHPDTSALPFSYVFGNNGVTTVVPAANIKACGMMRDVLKWKGRDARSKDCPKLDCINYEAFTPYNAEKMFQGIELLEKLRDGKVSSKELRFEISPNHIDEGIRLYNLGLQYFFGKVLIDRILSEGDSGLRLDNFPNEDDFLTGVYGDVIEYVGERNGQSEYRITAGSMSTWVDMAGMLAPRSVIDGDCTGLRDREYDSLSEFNEGIAENYDQYVNFRWLYALEGGRLQKVFGLESLTVANLKKIVIQWREVAKELLRLRTADAEKDFAPEMQVEFGIDHPEFVQDDIKNSVGLTEKRGFVWGLWGDEESHREIDLAGVALECLNGVN